MTATARASAASASLAAPWKDDWHVLEACRLCLEKDMLGAYPADVLRVT